MNRYDQEGMEKWGVTGAVEGFVNSKTKMGFDEMIMGMDAALQTTPNIGVPDVMTAYVDTEITNVLFNPRRVTEIFEEVKKGDWTAPYALFKVMEATGSIAPYGDSSPNGRSDTNSNFPKREQALFQTNISYGDFESALAGAAQYNLVAQKQGSAALTIAIASNYFYAYGVEGKDIYGLLNDPSKLPAIAAVPGAGGATDWKTKTTTEIYEDVLALYSQLVLQNNNIQKDDELILALPPTQDVYLSKSTDFNISATEMLMKNFKNLKVVTLPELEETATSDASCFLTTKTILGETVGQCAFGEKMRFGRLIPETSSYTQKITFTTYGTIIKHYSCIATMTGI